MAFQLPVRIETREIAAPPGTTILYPQTSGLANRQAENEINRGIIRQAREMVRQQAAELPAPPSEMIGHYELKTNQRGILSLTQSNYAYAPRMAHGVTLLRSLTFDVNSGRSYRLRDLFLPGADYVAVLSRIVAVQLRQRNLPLIHPFVAISPDQDYYLADKALVLYFQPYVITPYYVGFPMFPVSVYDVLSLAPEQGPLSVLAADIA